MSRSSLALLAAVALAAAGAPHAVRAHGVEAEVDQREGAVSVRARYPGGRPLADATSEVESPRGGAAPFAEGRTDRHGWLAFTPDVPGRWTVRIADASGHGKTVEVEVRSVATPTASSTSTSSPTPTASSTPTPGPTTIQLDAPGGDTPPSDARRGSSFGYTFRVLAALTAIVLAFRILLTVQRARRAKGR